MYQKCCQYVTFLGKKKHSNLIDGCLVFADSQEHFNSANRSLLPIKWNLQITCGLIPISMSRNEFFDVLILLLQNVQYSYICFYVKYNYHTLVINNEYWQILKSLHFLSDYRKRKKLIIKAAMWINDEDEKFSSREPHSGEYESALVLYHRAATVCPHDSSHNVAARRTTAMISSWNNPERSSTKLSVNTRDDAISKVTLCLKRAALSRERDISRSCDNLSITPDILK